MYFITEAVRVEFWLADNIEAIILFYIGHDRLFHFRYIKKKCAGCGNMTLVILQMQLRNCYIFYDFQGDKALT